MSVVVENLTSVLTPPGRGAVAVVTACGQKAIAGVNSHFQAANGRACDEQTLNRIVFGHWQDASGHREEAILCRTSPEEIEVHCHGGPAAVERITGHFVEAGCQIVPWQQWIDKHAPDAITAEAQIVLAEAPTRKTSTVLLQQHGGALIEDLHRIYQLIESNQRIEAQTCVNKLIARVPFGLHLTRPWRVVLAGRPNVGKSSLINALVGYQRAIVYDQPGTTRDVVTSVTALDGWPVALFDVAGLRETGEPLEAAGIALARETIAEADLVVWVMEVGSPPEENAQGEIVELVGQPLAPYADHAGPLKVLNKCDQLGESTQAWWPELHVSALTGEGIPRLIEAIIKRLMPTVPGPNEPVPFTLRQSNGLARLAAVLETCDLEGARSECERLICQQPTDTSQQPSSANL